MKITIAVGLIIALLSGTGFAQSKPRGLCKTGQARAFATLRYNPPYRVGTIPNEFTDSIEYFTRRYNCTGQSAQVRRVDLGTYDIKFPGVRHRTAIVSAISQEGVSASVYSLDSLYRVILRGPIIENGVAIRRDVPFSIVIF